MSVNKLIPIMTPVLNAMDDLNIDHDKFIPKFVRWATDAEKEIGSKYQYVIKRKVLVIEGCAACLPSDAVYIQTAILGDFGCDCTDLMANVCGALSLKAYGAETGSFLVVDIGGSNGSSIASTVNHSIQNNKLIFEQNYNGQSITIQYLAPETDCDGFTEVGENHKLAIQWYIKWQYYTNKSGMNTLEYGKANKAEAEWHRECAHARAVDSQLSESDRQEIVYGMLHNPFIGISLSNGMHTTIDNRSW